MRWASMSLNRTMSSSRSASSASLGSRCDRAGDREVTARAAHREDDLERRLLAVQAVAREAGLLARSMLADRGNLQIEMKGPQDFVSNADRAVERLIVERLTAAFPGDRFLGEE